MNPVNRLTWIALWATSLVFASAATALVTRHLTLIPDPCGVYLIGAVTITDPERLGHCRAIAEPLAHRTGG